MPLSTARRDAMRITVALTTDLIRLQQVTPRPDASIEQALRLRERYTAIANGLAYEQDATLQAGGAWLHKHSDLITKVLATATLAAYKEADAVSPELDEEVQRSQKANLMSRGDVLYALFAELLDWRRELATTDSTPIHPVASGRNDVQDAPMPEAS